MSYTFMFKVGVQKVDMCQYLRNGRLAIFDIHKHTVLCCNARARC